MRFYLFFIPLAIMFGGIFPLTGASELKNKTKLIFSMPDNDGVLISYADKVFAEVTRRTGLVFGIKKLPKKRALHEANRGKVDGAGIRVKGLASKFPNLIMIRVPLITVQHSYFAQNADIINSVSDLGSLIKHAQLKDYVVGYLFGSKKAEDELLALPDKNKQYFHSPENVFKMITLGRVGGYVAGPAITNRRILKQSFPDTKIKEIAVISEFDLFPYVHKKNIALIPQLEQTLAAMKKDGTLERIKQMTELE